MKKRDDASDLIHSYSESNKKAAHNSATGKYPILCADCDNRLGTTLDSYAKNWVIKAHNSASGIDTDTLNLARFMASVFWRASLSNHRMYKQFLHEKPEISALIKRAAYNKEETFKIGSYSIERLTDKNQGSSESHLSGLIFSPHIPKHKRKTMGSGFLMRMVFEGFIWDMAIPRVSHILPRLN